MCSGIVQIQTDLPGYSQVQLWSLWTMCERCYSYHILAHLGTMHHGGVKSVTNIQQTQQYFTQFTALPITAIAFALAVQPSKSHCFYSLFCALQMYLKIRPIANIFYQLLAIMSKTFLRTFSSLVFSYSLLIMETRYIEHSGFMLVSRKSERSIFTNAKMQYYLHTIWTAFFFMVYLSNDLSKPMLNKN